ncbi:MAG TPA: rhomboid family intramembrane serine protease [Candidatus Acidoferrum sp.]|nr:rhomboid family intramembrane serine protease [Candidatus Acidoferrum sp.]
MILIPLKHENMEGRRWPIVTFALIGLNILAFVGTHWTMKEQAPKLAEVRLHVLLLAAEHPELKMPEDAQQFVTDFQKANPKVWEQVTSPYRQVIDAADARYRMTDDTDKLQEEMDSLTQQFHDLKEKSVLLNYGFVPAHKKAITYLTSMFMHAGWLHLIGNMWFLWLAGFILEENWGRAIYPAFYLVGGFVASQIHALVYPNSIVPCLGASGAIAALMGAFLVRFPKLKIDMWATAFFMRFRFKAPAYSLLPLWLLTEIFYGTLVGQMSGTAHWAHIGGFIFGMLGALVIQHTGLEHKANAAIEQKVGWTADPAIVQGTECLEQGRLDEGIAVLRNYLQAKPDNVDGLSLLRQLFWRKNDVPAYLESSIKLCQLHLKAQDTEAALQDYQDYMNAGGKQMPAATWLELCRVIEGQQNYDRALNEYNQLAQTYPKERQSILALLSAGRISLKVMNRPSDALRFYNAAKASPVSHLDWETNIQAGIQAAEKSQGVPVGPA